MANILTVLGLNMSNIGALTATQFLDENRQPFDDKHMNAVLDTMEIQSIVVSNALNRPRTCLVSDFPIHGFYCVKLQRIYFDAYRNEIVVHGSFSTPTEGSFSENTIPLDALLTVNGLYLVTAENIVAKAVQAA